MMSPTVGASRPKTFSNVVKRAHPSDQTLVTSLPSGPLTITSSRKGRFIDPNLVCVKSVLGNAYTEAQSHIVGTS